MTLKKLSFGPVLFIALALTLGIYFTFAAVQGDFGLFNRVQIDAEADDLRITRDALRQELASIQNRTRRLSDDYLDLDLLDEQARDMLGMMRADEVVVR
jgi:cell division protein FtsB